MAKIHIGKNGPEKCPAKKQCRLKDSNGNPVPHFDSIEEAQQHIDNEGAKNAFSDLSAPVSHYENVAKIENRLKELQKSGNTDWEDSDEAQELAHEWKESYANEIHKETGWGESHIEVMMEIDTLTPDEILDSKRVDSWQRGADLLINRYAASQAHDFTLYDENLEKKHDAQTKLKALKESGVDLDSSDEANALMQEWRKAHANHIHEAFGFGKNGNDIMNMVTPPKFEQLLDQSARLDYEYDEYAELYENKDSLSRDAENISYRAKASKLVQKLHEVQESHNESHGTYYKETDWMDSDKAQSLVNDYKNNYVNHIYEKAGFKSSQHPDYSLNDFKQDLEAPEDYQVASQSKLKEWEISATLKLNQKMREYGAPAMPERRPGHEYLYGGQD